MQTTEGDEGQAGSGYVGHPGIQAAKAGDSWTRNLYRVWGVSGLWSSAAIPYSVIDTWPGRRSGGMIVVTSILGCLPFFLLVGFAGAIVLSFV